MRTHKHSSYTPSIASSTSVQSSWWGRRRNRRLTTVGEIWLTHPRPRWRPSYSSRIRPSCVLSCLSKMTEAAISKAIGIRSIPPYLLRELFLKMRRTVESTHERNTCSEDLTHENKTWRPLISCVPSSPSRTGGRPPETAALWRCCRIWRWIPAKLCITMLFQFYEMPLSTMNRRTISFTCYFRHAQ